MASSIQIARSPWPYRATGDQQGDAADAEAGLMG